jgi:DNA-binding HxlR family transcriptional regulator
VININFGDVFKYVGAFLAKNWQTIVLISVICLFFLTKNDYGALKKSMDAMSISYEEQIATLQALHEEEIARREEAVAIYERELATLTEKYESAIKNLQISKEEDVREYIRDFESQPDKLAREIEELLGIEYVE